MTDQDILSEIKSFISKAEGLVPKTIEERVKRGNKVFIRHRTIMTKPEAPKPEIPVITPQELDVYNRGLNALSQNSLSKFSVFELRKIQKLALKRQGQRKAMLKKYPGAKSSMQWTSQMHKAEMLADKANTILRSKRRAGIK